MKFPIPLPVTIVNHVTGYTYALVRAGDVECDQANQQGIASICNEPEVYQWLFRDLFEGRPYEDANAGEWLQWSRDGWSSGTHFVFAVVDGEKRVVAACDIKSTEPIAEIGYWSSARHRGVMTNALKAMCALAGEAGFRGLFAWTKEKNSRSQAVLERAGFERKPSERSGYERFELPLTVDIKK
jgi:RimJ/RimL family protein N-acetyltransferase